MTMVTTPSCDALPASFAPAAAPSRTLPAVSATLLICPEAPALPTDIRRLRLLSPAGETPLAGLSVSSAWTAVVPVDGAASFPASKRRAASPFGSPPGKATVSRPVRGGVLDSLSTGQPRDRRSLRPSPDVLRWEGLCLSGCSRFLDRHLLHCLKPRKKQEGQGIEEMPILRLRCTIRCVAI